MSQTLPGDLEIIFFCQFYPVSLKIKLKGLIEPAVNKKITLESIHSNE
jgi:hypothetical protein